MRFQRQRHIRNHVQLIRHSLPGEAAKYRAQFTMAVVMNQSSYQLIYTRPPGRSNATVNH
jgi:hypothetical protein